MTIETEGIKFDARVADPVSPVDGDQWFNTTDGRLRARIGGVTRELGVRTTIDVTFWSDASSGPWIEVGIGGNVVVSRFVFRGSAALGIPTSIKALVESDSGVTTRVTIYDLTNALQVAQASSVAVVPTILDLGALSNVPVAEAILEIQVERTVGSGNNKAKIGALSVHF